MDVTCKSCGSKLTIPNEKLPPNQVVNITCPKCKGKIKIDTREFNEEKDVKSKRDAGIAAFERAEDTTPLDLLEEGAKLALVMDADEAQAAEISATLDALSYKAVVAPSINDAMAKLRLHHFDLVMLSDGFDGQGLSNNPISHYFNHLSISIRRKTFLVLLSNSLKTMDNIMAFSLSANLIINPEDLTKLNLILNKALSDHEKFYKVFIDSLKETGKE
jgi:predicted Zn finger-like uncharacterized protein